MKRLIALFGAACAVAIIPWVWGPQAQPIFVVGVAVISFMAGMLWQGRGLIWLVPAFLTGAYALIRRIGWELHTRGAAGLVSSLYLIAAFSGFVAVCALTGWFLRNTAKKRLANRTEPPHP